ncbi:MAG: beta-propeller domain-containing protein, partial [Oscillospiraceae bacterium]|nr:beta-propeller domain-containing protein [Oscillospiraceae bacterium]
LVNGMTRRIGMKLALFDVSEEDNPTEKFNEVIGGPGTRSVLLEDHRALLFSKEKNIIAFPITMRENHSVTFRGVIIYGLDLDEGFTVRGKISHIPEGNQNRGTDFDLEIDRIIYIGDTLFTMSRGLIMATDINTMEYIGSIEI